MSYYLYSRIASLPILNNAKNHFRKLEASFLRLGEYLQKKSERRKLQQILEEEAGYRGVVIFPPTINWKVPLFQRPHQLALTFARQGYLVFFCEPFNSQIYSRGFHQIQKCLYVSYCPLDVYRSILKPIVFTLAYSREYLSNFSQPLVIYEYIDELEVLNGNLETMWKDHEILIREATIVVATADQLFQRVKLVRPDTLLLPNAVDYEFFCKKIGLTLQPPEDFQKILIAHRPIVGYYGSLAKWFDYSLFVEVARLRPDLDFVLIGLDYDGSILKSGIEGFSNIHWIGPKWYADLPAYLKYFDVAIIPFLVNDITQSTSPIKLFEYWAAKKPVVTTAMYECVKAQPLTLIASTPDDFIRKIDDALHLKDDPDYLTALERAAAENTWDARVSQMLVAIDEKTGRGNA